MARGHAFRRGLATNVHRLDVSDKVIQQVLPHANVTTAMNICVKSADEANAIRALEAMCPPGLDDGVRRGAQAGTPRR